MDVQYVAANIRGYFTRQNRVETLWDRMGIREKPWPKNILADHKYISINIYDCRNEILGGNCNRRVIRSTVI